MLLWTIRGSFPVNTPLKSHLKISPSHILTIFFFLKPAHLLPLCIGYNSSVHKSSSSLVAQMVENLPAMWKMWVRSLGREDPLEEGMATHSIILAWRIPQTEEPGRQQSVGSQRVGHDWVTKPNTQCTPLYIFIYLSK